MRWDGLEFHGVVSDHHFHGAPVRTGLADGLDQAITVYFCDGLVRRPEEQRRLRRSLTGQTVMSRTDTNLHAITGPSYSISGDATGSAQEVSGLALR